MIIYVPVGEYLKEERDWLNIITWEYIFTRIGAPGAYIRVNKVYIYGVTHS